MNSNIGAVIIAAAGCGRRMRSYGSKSLLCLSDGRTILRRQIDIIKSVLPQAEIIVVVGFDADKIIKTIPAGIRIIENENFEETNVARSISMGLRATTSEKCLVIYGDLVFNKSTLENLEQFKTSCVLLDNNNKVSISEVGVTTDGNSVVHFNYGLNPKWSSIMILTGKELDLFKVLGSQSDRRKLVGHEILNMIIDNGGYFSFIKCSKKDVVEIDCTKDLLKTQKVLN